jgi:hypothetical protein
MHRASNTATIHSQRGDDPVAILGSLPSCGLGTYAILRSKSVNITRKSSAAATQKRSLQPNESEEAMPTEQQEEAIGAVRSAAVPISIAIDAMVAELPADANLAEIAFDLIDGVEAMGSCGEIISIFKEGLIARQALTELGVDLK